MRIILNKDTIFWTTILVLSAVVHLWGLGDRIFSFDESIHGFFSYKLATTGIYYHNPQTHGPILFYLNVLVFWLFHANDFTARLIPSAVGTVLVISPLFFQRWIGSTACKLCGVLLLFSPLTLYFGRYLRNDIYILFLLTIWIYGIFLYLDQDKNRGIYTISISAALSFACKEVSFISITILSLFLLWIMFMKRRNSTWIPPAEILLLHVTFCLPFAVPLIPRLIPYVDAYAWLERQIWLAFGLVVITVLLTVCLCWFLIRTLQQKTNCTLTYIDWLKQVVLFWGLCGLLFTNFLRSPGGLFTGFFQSLGYWLGQHPANPGGQPFYYYLFLLAHYEIVLLIGLLLGSIWLLRRCSRFKMIFSSRTTPDVLFLIFTFGWFCSSLVAYSIAGEKMPWLSLHIILPAAYFVAIYSAVVVKQFRDYGLLKKTSIVGFVLCLLLVNADFSHRLNFIQPGSPKELAAYSQGTPDLIPLAEFIEEKVLSNQRIWIPTRDKWALSWYLADVSPEGLVTGSEPEIYDLSIQLSTNEEFRHRNGFRTLWWPLQNYKWTDLTELANTIIRTGNIAGLWDVLYGRAYTGISLDDWPNIRRVQVVANRPDPVVSNSEIKKNDRSPDFQR